MFDCEGEAERVKVCDDDTDCERVNDGLSDDDMLSERVRSWLRDCVWVWDAERVALCVCVRVSLGLCVELEDSDVVWEAVTDIEGEADEVRVVDNEGDAVALGVIVIDAVCDTLEVLELLEVWL